METLGEWGEGSEAVWNSNHAEPKPAWICSEWFAWEPVCNAPKSIEAKKGNRNEVNDPKAMDLEPNQECSTCRRKFYHSRFHLSLQDSHLKFNFWGRGVRGPLWIVWDMTREFVGYGMRGCQWKEGECLQTLCSSCQSGSAFSSRAGHEIILYTLPLTNQQSGFCASFHFMVCPVC